MEIRLTKWSAEILPAGWPWRTDPCIAPFFTLVENAEFFYFSHNFFLQILNSYLQSETPNYLGYEMKSKI